MYLPLYIDFRKKKVLVVGLGRVGRKRAEKLLKFGASVTAIDRKKIKFKKVRLIQRELHPDDIPPLKKYFLVVASTDDGKLNAAIAEKAKREGCLVSRADRFKGGNVIFPAVVETRAGMMSFTTFGKNPKLTKLIKEALELGLPDK